MVSDGYKTTTDTITEKLSGTTTTTTRYHRVTLKLSVKESLITTTRGKLTYN